MHYTYFLCAVIFCIVTIAMTIVTFFKYFETEEKSGKDANGFLMIFLTAMSIYQSYLIFVLVKIFFLK